MSPAGPPPAPSSASTAGLDPSKGPSRVMGGPRPSGQGCPSPRELYTQLEQLGRTELFWKSLYELLQRYGSLTLSVPWASQTFFIRMHYEAAYGDL